MRKTITIADPMQVKIGDKAYFKGYYYGFIVLKVDKDDLGLPFAVRDPMLGLNCWPLPSRFDYAIREVKEPEWPDIHSIILHVYLGSDGRRYIYNPSYEDDMAPWVAEGRYAYRSRESMESDYPDALPLTELKLVPAKDDDNEQ